MGVVLCYPEALSSLSCLILPKKVNSITANMKKGWILRFRGDQMSLKGIGVLGELTKEKEGCRQGGCKSGKSSCERMSDILLHFVC